MSKKKARKIEGVVAVIRVRGRTHIRGEITDTLKVLNLTRKNNCVLLSYTPEVEGMIKKVNDYVTWGEAKKLTVEKLFSKRGRVAGGGKLTDEHIKSNSELSTMKEFVDAVADGSLRAKDVPGVKPLFRLNPPRGGFERGGIKKSVSVGGALGYRGEDVSKLIERMI